VLGSQCPDKGRCLPTLDSKSRGVRKIKIGSPDMALQTRKTLKTPRLYKKDAQGSQKIQCQGPGKKNRLMPERQHVTSESTAPLSRRSGFGGVSDSGFSSCAAPTY